MSEMLVVTCADLYAVPVRERVGELLQLDAALLVLADAALHAP